MESQDFQDALKYSPLVKSIIIGDHPSNQASTILEDLKTFIENKYHLLQFSANGLERVNEYH